MISGLNYSGTLVSKFTKKYEKDGQEGIEYKIKIGVPEEFVFIIARVNEDIFNKLEEKRSYTIPVGFRTFLYGPDNDKKVLTSYYIRKGDIIDNDTGEVI